MRRVVHLSDLHFGRDRPALLTPLLHAVNSLAPDLVVISGDFTQRARPEQFKTAAAFIAALQPPTLSIPGNHDVPLDNLLLRIFLPWRGYRKWIDRDLEPTFADSEIVVIGVNTVNRFAWQRGWFKSRALRKIQAAFDKSDRVHIVAAHHPLEHPTGEHKTLMHGAQRGLTSLSDSRADVVLSGHLHSWRAGPFAKIEGRNAFLQIHAGTSLSDRLRGEVNDFNLLEIEPDKITVRRFTFTDAANAFAMATTVTFQRTLGGWQSVP